MALLVHRRALLIAVVALASACSDDGSIEGAIDLTEVTLPPVTTSPATASSDSTVPASTDGPASTGGPSSTGGPAATTTTVSGSVVVEAGGWRLEITTPRAGSTIGNRSVICYVLTGASREPVAALDVTLQPLGATTGARALVDIAVGAGSVEVDLAGAAQGRYDMRIQLALDGAALDGAVLTLPGVTISPVPSATSCS